MCRAGPVWPQPSCTALGASLIRDFIAHWWEWGCVCAVGPHSGSGKEFERQVQG